MRAELIVKLIIPDTTAITAFHTLEKMGYRIKTLERADYYVFEADKDFKKFSEEIKKVDILVNANKHRAAVKKPEDKFENTNVKVLVKDIDQGKGLLRTLQNRLGFKQIKSVEKGVLWTIGTKDKALAKKIAENLLYSRHYQECKVI